MITNKPNRLFVFIALVCVVMTGKAQQKPFPQSLSYAGCIKPNHVTQSSMNASVSSYYDYWKASHLRNNLSTLPGGYYVAGNITGSCEPYCPGLGSSEGQGYGMVITAFMAGHDPNAKTIFDGLFKTARAYRSSANPALMGWVVSDQPGAQGKFGSATDGDLDIAYSLILAHDQWGSTGAINYLEEAKKMIAACKAEYVTTANSINLGDWDSNTSTDSRPSDWMVSHFRAFYDVTADQTWLNVISKLYSKYNEFVPTYSAATGLISDFVVGTPTRPAPEWFLDEFKETNTYYYNACRVPLRIVLDYALNGATNSKTIADKMATWIKGKTGGNPANIVAGYQLNGTAFGTYPTAVFGSPLITASVTNSSHQAFVNSGWDWMKTQKEDYYADSYNMLCMIFITGNWWKPGIITNVPVTGVAVTPTSATVAQGSTQQLTATVSPSNATNKTVTWSTSNASVASVNSSGLVTGVAAGSATITVTTQDGGRTATSAITVTTTPTSLPAPWVTADIGAVGVSGSASYSVPIFTARGSGADIWGTADAFRYVYQTITGDVTITARVASLGNTNAWAKAGVMVRGSTAANSVHAFTTVSAASGTSFQRRPTTGGTSASTAGPAGAAPYWVRLVRTGNSFTSFVSTTGTTWTQVGVATTITMSSSVLVGLAVTSHNNTVLTTATFDNVTVSSGNVPVTGVTMSPTSASINVGATQQLTATVSPSNATNKNVSWTTSNSSVATVSTSGLVTGVAAGSATITVTTQDGSRTATSAITVSTANVPVTGVSVSPTSATLNAGATQQLTATVSPTNATNKNVSWTTSNSSVATVSTSGLVTGVAAGSATITVTTQDGGMTATSAITVSTANVPVTGVSVSPTSATLNAGATQQLTATVSPTNATNKNVSWTTSNSSVATVSTSGLVTGVAAGSATITVTTQDGGMTATSAITVTSAPPSNLALNKATTVSSIEDATFVGGKAVDGNGTTRWASLESDAQWIYVDLVNIYNVNRVKINWEAAYGRDYQVQIASSSSGPWSTMKTVTGNTALVNDHTGLTGTGRFVRINCTLRGTPWGYSIWELEVYGIMASGLMVADRAPIGEDEPVILYPNPADNTITFTTAEKDIKIYNYLGKEETLPSAEGNILNVSSLSPGVYTIVVQKGNNKVVKRFIKK